MMALSFSENTDEPHGNAGSSFWIDGSWSDARGRREVLAATKRLYGRVERELIEGNMVDFVADFGF